MFKKKFQKEEVVVSDEDIQIKKTEAKRKRESRNKRNRINKKIKKL